MKPGLRLLACTLSLALGGCTRKAEPPLPQAYWLWAGVPERQAVNSAREVYLLEGEIIGRPVHLESRRSATPATHGQLLWLVYRTDSLVWPPEVIPRICADLQRWRDAGNTVAGVQIDFDAATHHLDRYSIFLADVRKALPRSSKLSITGLMDWSANGDPRVLATLAGQVDEVVIQTYQGRSTLPGYAAYVERLTRFPLPFRIGTVEGGDWIEPARLRSNPMFRGYVVFLLPPRHALTPQPISSSVNMSASSS